MLIPTVFFGCVALLYKYAVSAWRYRRLLRMKMRRKREYIPADERNALGGFIQRSNSEKFLKDFETLLVEVIFLYSNTRFSRPNCAYAAVWVDLLPGNPKNLPTRR